MPEFVLIFIAVGVLVVLVAVCILIKWILGLRVVVPPNVVHIVQRNKKTVSYGANMEDGNVYYEFPQWVPGLGVTVAKLPVSNFDVTLSNYEAYDRDRLPFVVDVTAFFRIEDTNKAAAKVYDTNELRHQLQAIVQGAVRTIMAQSSLSEIMSERGQYGEQFTAEVTEQLGQWGVVAVRNIELMDIKDVRDSQVIENVMRMKKSEIERDSRVTVAKNTREAQEAEILANQEVELKQATAAQAVGERKAATEQAVGIAQQMSRQAVAEESRKTKEKDMAVTQVEQVRAAEIMREATVVKAEQERKQIEIAAEAERQKITVSAEAKKYETEKLAEAEKTRVVIAAEARKFEIEQVAAADLVRRQNEAAGTRAIGEAAAKSKELDQLASVTAQTTLAKEIGNNEGYQQYLITIEQIKAHRDVGVEQAKNISGADIKIIANSGDIQGGLGKIGELFTSKGTTQLVGALEGFAQSPIGAGLLEKVIKPTNNG